MDIKNVKINDYAINYKNSKFENIINQNKHLIPELNKKSISFELINSNEAFANGIRRTFNDELLVKSLDVNIYDLKTDDKYILPDNIIERINLIPVLQNISDDIIFNINVINNTNDIINIYSKDIINKNKNDKTIYFNSNILLCSLKPNRYLYINNINIKKEYGFNDHKFSMGSYNYEIINTDFNINSLNNNITDFKIELITNNNIEIKNLIILIYDTLYFRLKNIQLSINNYDINTNSTDINKLVNDIFIIPNQNIFEIHINNEYHTIGNLITKYVFNLDKNIELINYKLEHPLRHKIIINIKHNQYKKIINDAIENIIKDLDIFKNLLIKYIK
jgi:DNA-directed RNA polymerase subunit L